MRGNGPFVLRFSLLGAFVALEAASPTASVIALRWLTLLLLAADVAAGYRFGGMLWARSLFLS